MIRKIQKAKNQKRLQPAFLILISILFTCGVVVCQTLNGYMHYAALQFAASDDQKPAFDFESPTGYEGGMRVTILPVNASDGYQWIMHTQKLIANGGWRIHRTDIDNAPDGREIHWSSLFIWWLLFLGFLHSSITGLPLAASVEAVAVFSNVFLHLLLVVVLPWISYRRLGTIASVGLAFSLVSSSSFFGAFAFGNTDHHGLTLAATLVTGLFIGVGGGGWCKCSNGDADQRPATRTSKSVPNDLSISHASARRYFIASGLVGGFGLWISAASAVPTMLGIGIGALLSCYLFGRKQNAIAYHPPLWRLWGIAGSLSSFAFYLLEYFPNNMGLRLEVNHPLYSLAWLGGSELLYRFTQWRTSRIKPWESLSSSLVCVMALSCLVITPLLAWFQFADCFWLSDKLLWSLHRDYIYEFMPFQRWLQQPGDASSKALTMFFLLIALISVRLFWISNVNESTKGTLVVLMLPGVIFTFLGMYQIRWLSQANAAWLAVLPIVIHSWFAQNRLFQLNLGERIIGGGMAIVFFLLFPFKIAMETMDAKSSPPTLTPFDVTVVGMRELSHKIRRNSISKDLVVVSGASTTTWWIYFGGMKGLGTLYWENLPGIRSASKVFSAESENELRLELAKHHVTHLAVFSADNPVDDYNRLSQNLSPTATPSGSYLTKLIADKTTPQWLRPIYFKNPELVDADWLILAEVRPNQTKSEALFGIAVFDAARGQRETALANLRTSLELAPDFQDAWLEMGKLLLLEKSDDEAWAAFEKGIAGKSASEIVYICQELSARCYSDQRHAQASRLLRKGLEAIPGHPQLTNNLAWIRATSLDDSVFNSEEALKLASSGAGSLDRAVYLDTLAVAQAASLNFPDAIRNCREAIEEYQRQSHLGNESAIESATRRLRLFESSKPYRR